LQSPSPPASRPPRARHTMIPRAAKSGDGWGKQQRTSAGRRIVADLGLKGSEVTLREEPWAAVLAAGELGQRCDWSFAAATADGGGGAELLRCPATGLRFASTKDRQRAKAEYLAFEARACEAMPSGRRFSDLPASLRLAARALWRGACDQGIDGPIPWLGLEDHWHSLSESRRGEFMGMGELCAGVVRRGLGEGALHPPDALGAARLLAVIAVNAICITNEEFREIGLGLYLHASAFNHSEEPNCSQSFDGRDLVVRARTAVKKGEELTITYAELAESSRFRRAQLRTQYLFDPLEPGAGGTPAAGAVAWRDGRLEEVLGRVTQGWEPLASGLAWSPEAGFVPAQGSGSAVASDAVVSWATELYVLWQEASDSGDDGRKLQAARKLWEAACLGDARGAKWQLGVGHALRLHVARAGMDLAIEAQSWAEAAAWARAVCKSEAEVYPNPWPVPACSLARLAKLEVYLGNFEAACAAGTRALQTFGALGIDGSMCQEVRQMLAQAGAEGHGRTQAMAEQRRRGPRRARRAPGR